MKTKTVVIRSRLISDGDSNSDTLEMNRNYLFWQQINGSETFSNTEVSSWFEDNNITGYRADHFIKDVGMKRYIEFRITFKSSDEALLFSIRFGG